MTTTPGNIQEGVQPRRFPFPYRAMLAICSDLDETPDAETYFDTCRLLNTREDTSLGTGVGLEVANSIYFDMPAGQFAYWNGSDRDRDRVRLLIGSGHIDCLHSFGDEARARPDALRALDDLEKHDCRLPVWVDHGVARTNLGDGIMRGHGDEPGHAAYHADRTLAHGVRYVWRGRVTSVIGQNRPFSLGGIRRRGRAMASVVTLCKEGTKHVLARGGSRKYAIQRLNRLVSPVSLRDGSTVHEFVRCNPHYGGVSSCDRGEDIGDVLTPAFLDRLVQREGVCILYTHLGKLARRDGRLRFPGAALLALQALADRHERGEILVTTTRRLLDYCRRTDDMVFSARDGREGAREIAIDAPDRAPPGEPQGLTFYTDATDRTTISFSGAAIDGLRANPPDHTGRPSVSVPWTPLEYPQE